MKMLISLVSLLFAVQVAAKSGASYKPGNEIIETIMAMGVGAPAIAPAIADEAAGPYQRLVLKGGTVVTGTGAPAMGPVDIIITNNRITEINGGGTGSLHLGDAGYDANTKVIDVTGKYILPGFIDAHTHFGTPSHIFGGALTSSEYVGKLLLAHGITTVREVGSLMGLDWLLEHKKLSDQGRIAAPRIKAYALFPEMMESEQAAEKWVRAVYKAGADGVKFLGAAPELIKAALEIVEELGMGSAYHHSQLSVSNINVIDSARLGADSMEHWYGLPEAMFEGQTVQHYPLEYNYADEQDRFRAAGQLWGQTASLDSDSWQKTRDELIALDFTWVPTFTIYEANRDVMRARTKEWNEEYVMPYMLKAFEPNPAVHGSYHFDWTSSDEISWKNNYKLWMSFVNDYKNHGGRVAAGADSGFIYGVYGFGYIRELELLQEAGFHPLEVLQSATIKGAELLGLGDQLGSIQVGKIADLVVVEENPLANFKVLYGNGHYQMDWATKKMGRSKGIVYTIKDGIVFDVSLLLRDVKRLVAEEKSANSVKE